MTVQPFLSLFFFNLKTNRQGFSPSFYNLKDGYSSPQLWLNKKEFMSVPDYPRCLS